jgi:hypothetical protein
VDFSGGAAGELSYLSGRTSQALRFALSSLSAEGNSAMALSTSRNGSSRVLTEPAHVFGIMGGGDDATSPDLLPICFQLARPVEAVLGQVFDLVGTATPARTGDL